MIQARRKIYIDFFGNCSDGTSMYCWPVEKLIDCINTCWDKEIVDRAKIILKQNYEQIQKHGEVI